MMEKYTTDLESELTVLRAQYNELPTESPDREKLRVAIQSLEDKIRERNS